MRFKYNNQNDVESKNNPIEEKPANKIEKSFVDLIQLEIDKCHLLSCASSYFYKNGFADYKKFIDGLEKVCLKTKCCLINEFQNNIGNLPEFTIPESVNFENEESPFELLKTMEDSYEEKVNNLITLSFEEKNWKLFSYFLDKVKAIDHICCRALNAIKNKSNLLALCEQRILEK